MPDLQEKLRRFRLSWITDAAAATPHAGQVLGFRSKADDKPPLWVRDVAKWGLAARLAAAPRRLPRFVRLAEHVGARRAA